MNTLPGTHYTYFFNNNKLISLAHYIQQTIHYGMMYSIDLPVGVSKSVADSVVSGWTHGLEAGQESHQRSPGTARIDT